MGISTPYLRVLAALEVAGDIKLPYRVGPPLVKEANDANR